MSAENWTRYNNFYNLIVGRENCDLSLYRKFDNISKVSARNFLIQFGLDAGWSNAKSKREVERLYNHKLYKYRNNPREYCELLPYYINTISGYHLQQMRGSKSVAQNNSKRSQNQKPISAKVIAFVKRNFPKLETGLKCTNNSSNTVFVFIGSEGEALEFPKHKITSSDESQHEITTLSEKDAAYIIYQNGANGQTMEKLIYFTELERKQKEFKAEARPQYYDGFLPEKTNIDLDRLTGKLEFYQQLLNDQYRYEYIPLGFYQCAKLNATQFKNVFSSLMSDISKIADQRFEKTEKQFTKATKF